MINFNLNIVTVSYQHDNLNSLQQAHKFANLHDISINKFSLPVIIVLFFANNTIELYDISNLDISIRQQIDIHNQFKYYDKYNITAFSINFNNLEYQKRLVKPWSKSLLARAIYGRTYKSNLVVLDACAGLGRDAILLAHMGAKVVALECNPIMALLLNNARDLYVKNIDLQIYNLEFINFIKKLVQPNLVYDLVYLDPMFVDPKDTALPKKSTQLIRKLCCNPVDPAVLLQHALAFAKTKVVLKRSRQCKVLYPERLNSQLYSKLLRYDIYLV